MYTKTLEDMPRFNETDVDDPRSRQHTAWVSPLPPNTGYGAPDSAPVIPNKPSLLKTYGDGSPTSYAVPPQQKYEQAWSSQLSTPLPDWQEQHYAINAQQHAAHTTVKEYDLLDPNSSKPLGFSSYDIAPVQASAHYDEIIATLEQMEQQRAGMLANPIYAGNTPQSVQPFQPTQPQPLHSQPSYFQRAKNFLWRNTQRRVTTIIITTLIIGGIIGAYLGITSSGSSSKNCTYPEGVNQKFTELQTTLTAGSTGLTIPGLDPATCSLISSVINNTVNALKIGGYMCWQNVQSALMPLASSALALNMDSIAQIITAVKQYCFPSSASSTGLTASTPITSPANTFTTFKTTPTTSAPTTITTTTSGAGTTAMTTTTPIPSTVISTITSTSPTMIQTTTTSLVTTSTGTTTTLVPSTTTTVPAGTTTVTTLAPTTTTTVFASSSTSTTITTTTPTTTITTLSTTTPTITTALSTITITSMIPTPSCASHSLQTCPSYCCCLCGGCIVPVKNCLLTEPISCSGRRRGQPCGPKRTCATC